MFGQKGLEDLVRLLLIICFMISTISLITTVLFNEIKHLGVYFLRLLTNHGNMPTCSIFIEFNIGPITL